MAEQQFGHKKIEVDSRSARTLIPQCIPLRTRLTSVAWDGDSFSTTAKTLIDLSAVFGAPANIKMVLLYVAVQDSGAGGTDCYMILGPTNAANVGLGISAPPANDRWTRQCMVVPCDANGDIYYQIVASGASTFDVFMHIWGYWI